VNLFLLLYVAVVAAMSVHIFLRDTYSPQARMAWFVVVVLVPYVGAVLYYFLGRNKLNRRATMRHAQIVATIRAKAARYKTPRDTVEALIHPDFAPAFRYATSINGFQPTDGNTVELMADADETVRRLVADIDAATDHVHVLTYIWLDDGTGTAVAEALMHAAQRGVTCRALADGMGSRAFVHSPLWTRMREAGVQTAIALPFSNVLNTLLFSRIDLRNHRKIVVIDGQITYCGSRNMADPEFRTKPRFAPWVDVMLRVTGPVVTQNALLFASDWMQATNQPFEDFRIAPVPHQGNVCAQVMGDGPTGRGGATPQLVATLLSCARREVVITTPYFVPDALLLGALTAAAWRGVQVTLIFPARNDSWIVAAASHSYYRQLLEAGCTIHEFQGGLLHAKSLTVDGTVCLVGSSNLDLRSFDLNYENNLLVQDEAVTRAVRERQASYLARSTPVSLDAVRAVPAPRRIFNNVVATLGPVL